MTYNDLQALCERKKILTKEVLNELGMTYPGLRDALNRDTLAVKKLKPLCKILQITPNEFMGWNDNQNYSATQVGMLNSQNFGVVGIDLLRQQLEEKDRQMAAMDSHIEKLLNILNKD